MNRPSHPGANDLIKPPVPHDIVRGQWRVSRRRGTSPPPRLSEAFGPGPPFEHVNFELSFEALFVAVSNEATSVIVSVKSIVVVALFGFNVEVA